MNQTAPELSRAGQQQHYDTGGGNDLVHAQHSYQQYQLQQQQQQQQQQHHHRQQQQQQQQLQHHQSLHHLHQNNLRIHPAQHQLQQHPAHLVHHNQHHHHHHQQQQPLNHLYQNDQQQYHHHQQQQPNSILLGSQIVPMQTSHDHLQQHHQHHLQEQSSSSASASSSNCSSDTVLAHELTILEQKAHACDGILKRIHQGQEDFIIDLQQRGKLQSILNYFQASSPQDAQAIEKAQIELQQHQNFLKDKANELSTTSSELLMEQRKIFNEMVAIQHVVLYEHLPRWKLEQQFANNGSKLETFSLDQIQIWVEKLTSITWRIRNQLRGLYLLFISKCGQNVHRDFEILNQLGLDVVKSLETLILNTFVVEKQPPQVMKTNTRFASTLRFLIGSSLHIELLNPTVRVHILSESNARAIIQRQQDILRSTWAQVDSPTTSMNVSATPTSGAAAASTSMREATSGIVSPSTGPQSMVLSSHSSTPIPPTNQLQHVYSDNHQTDLSLLHQTNNPQSPPCQQQFFQQQQQQQLPRQQQQQAQFHNCSQVPSPSNSPQYNSIQTNTFSNNNNTDPSKKVLNISEFDPSGEILNNGNILEYQENTRQLVCQFRNMQLKKIKRTEKKGTESVMDEKFVLLFHSVFRIAAPLIDTSCLTNCNENNALNNSASLFTQGDFTFQITAFSLPVVVIVHGNQEPHAWATVTWHNAFARPNELLYQVPDKVPWRDLGQVLSDKFSSFSGKGLSQQNLEYLATKISKNRIIDTKNELYVSWNQFAKEPLPEKSFTFWEWFHSIIRLTKEHLRDLWNADRIYGFIGKKGCVDLLLGSSSCEPKPIGTFLLRYSETELGGITVAWVSNQQQQNSIGGTSNSSSSGGGSSTSSHKGVQILHRNSPTNTSSNIIMHLQPFVSKDLNTRTLADRIRDLKDLVYLYPDIPKDDAFKAYYTPLNDTTQLANGYVKPMLIQTLVTNYPKSNFNDNVEQMEGTVTPATPNSFSQSSPEGIYQDNTFITEMDSTYPAYENVNEFNNTIQ